MARDEEELDPFCYWGAGALGILGTILVWLTWGPGYPAYLAWIAIAGVLIVAMLLLPEAQAAPVQAVCYAVGLPVATLAMCGMALLPGVIAYTFSRTVVETFPRSLQAVTLLGWLLLLAAISAFLYSRPLRRRIHAWFASEAPEALQNLRPPERVPALGGILLYLNFVVVAMGCFASVAHLLQGVSSPPLFLPATRPVEHGTLADFLLWHLLDSIPGLKVPETIKWPAPLAYERPGAGWLLLLFKVMVIVPVVSGIGHYLKDEEESAPATPNGDRGATRRDR